MDNNLMALAMRSAVLVCLSSALCHAETWSGTLVDSRCWDFQENNTKDTSVYVDRDRNMEFRACAPTAKTKSFAVVLPYGQNLKLDSEGNAKAAELVQKIGKRSPIMVGVTGEANKNTVKVDSISMVR
jgi:hypothetical protein